MNVNCSNKLSLFSFIYALFVVLGHMTYVIVPQNQNMYMFTHVVSNYVAMAMGYFFFVSGYLFYRKFDLSKLLIKWRNRVKSLLIPFVIWNTIALLVLRLLKIAGLSKAYIWYININNLADGPLWYVLCLMVYAVCAPIIYWLIQNKGILWTLFSILIVLDICIDWGILERYFYYLPVYILGAGIGLHYSSFFEEKIINSNVINSEKKEWMKAVLLFLVVSIIFAILSYDFVGIGNDLIKIIVRATSPFLTFICFRNCKMEHVCLICKSSFFIYCGHEVLDMIFIHTSSAKRIFYFYSWPSQTIWGCMILTALILGVLIALYLGLRKICPKLFSIVCGGRV